MHILQGVKVMYCIIEKYRPIFSIVVATKITLLSNGTATLILEAYNVIIVQLLINFTIKKSTNEWKSVKQYSIMN